MPAATLACLLAASAAAQKNEAPAETTLGSVHALVQRSAKEALEWSPRAKLYAIYGQGPKDGVLLEEWTLVYGDPAARDGFYAVKFGDGVIQERHVCRGGHVAREYYWEGKLRNTMQGSPAGGQADPYLTNQPLGGGFMDAPRLDSLLKARGFKKPKGERWQLELSHLVEPKVDEADGIDTRHIAGFFLDGVYRTIGRIPPNGRDRTEWIVDNQDEAVFIDAATGKLINRRPNVIKGGPDSGWLVQ